MYSHTGDPAGMKSHDLTAQPFFGERKTYLIKPQQNKPKGGNQASDCNLSTLLDIK